LASHHHRRARVGLIFIALFALSGNARAIRPFVTDDARTVGKAHVQLETYFRRDKFSLQHWLLPALGPTDWLELTVGGVHGVDGIRDAKDHPHYSFAGPLVQAKLLLRETVPNHFPGLAVAVGGVTETGHGGFEPPGESGYGYLAASQAFFKEDDFLIHMNIGFTAVNAPDIDPLRLTYGIGTQLETIFDFHLIGEIYSGDPYIPGSAAAYQAGFRQIFNDHLQLDFTWGGGIAGAEKLPFFLSSGIRVVSAELW
jgi:hypothetical protein